MGQAAAAVVAAKAVGAGEAAPYGPHIATNTYPWGTFAGRDGVELPVHSQKLLEKIAAAGLQGYEPGVESAGELAGLGERLQAAGLEMRSLYVNSVLHDEAQSEGSIETVLAIAAAAQPLGTRIIVTNPAPLRWGGPEDKSDRQLRLQAANLDRLGQALRGRGLTLAYHNHDAELRQGARELNHMLTATDPEAVKFCLDAHWVYRGSGNSEVAVFDTLARYHDRIVELHLRQSTGGVWQESFTLAGDIDYRRLLAAVADREPHLVLEQAVEAGSPRSLDAVAAHRQGVRNLLDGVKGG